MWNQRSTPDEANGSRECAPDDRLREAIHGITGGIDCFVALLLAMSKSRSPDDSEQKQGRE